MPVDLELVNLHRLALHDILGVVDLALDDHLVQLLLVALHLGERLHLRHGDVLLVPQRDDLVEREDQVERVPRDALLVRLLLRVLRKHLAQQAQDVEILQDVALLVRHEQQEHRALLQGLVHVPHVLSLHVRVLLARAHELGERREETLDADARHRHELPRHEGCRDRKRGQGVSACAI